jgi:mRNA-degrading endonuclease RelE of RelBE toxin-antitoxin system
MNFTVAKTFNRSLEKLTGEEQTRAKAAVFDFQVNPANPGFSYEKLHRAKTAGFRSARISADLRLIVHQDGEDVCACFVGHHEDAYRWSESHKHEVHPVTGSMQMVELLEVVREVIREKEVAPPLFAKFDRDYILALGVPTAWLDAVMAVSSDDHLLEMVSHLPEEAAERLLELADGRPVPRPEPVKDNNPYEHPDAKRRFKIIDSKDALREALEYPWEQWIVFLHPTQRKTVERTYRGPARVSGAAGTGKTVVALHRAAHLARKHPDARILLTTFSRTLAFRLSHQADLLLATEPAVRGRITVDNLHKLARDVWTSRTGQKFNALTPDALLQVLERANTSLKTPFPLPFIKSEWENVIEPGAIS